MTIRVESTSLHLSRYGNFNRKRGERQRGNLERDNSNTAKGEKRMSKISLRSISVVLFFIFSFSFLLLFSPPLHAQCPNLTIGNYQMVDYKRISSTVWVYTYRADITNGGTATAMGVTATVKSLVATTKVTADLLNFGDVPAGATQTSR
jgi:hypothetical protein